jgi:hypothetical protein
VLDIGYVPSRRVMLARDRAGLARFVTMVGDGQLVLRTKIVC